MLGSDLCHSCGDRLRLRLSALCTPSNLDTPITDGAFHRHSDPRFADLAGNPSICFIDVTKPELSIWCRGSREHATSALSSVR